MALCLQGLASASASSTAERWRAQVPSTLQSGVSMAVLSAMPDGGFLAGQPAGDDLLWVSHFAADGSLAQGPSIGPPRVSGVRPIDGGGFAAFDQVYDLIDGVHPERMCERRGWLLGQPLNRYGGLHGLGPHLRADRPLAEILFATVYWDRPLDHPPHQLVLFDRDCNQRVLLEGDSALRQIRVSRDGQSVYAVDSASNSLQRIDAQGIRWAVPLSGSVQNLELAGNGDVLLRDGSGHRRVSADGILRWQRPLTDFPLPLFAFGDNDEFTYVVESLSRPTASGSRPFEQRISILDADGATRAQRTHTSEVLIAGIATLSPRALWRAEAPVPLHSEVPTNLPSRAVRIGADGDLVAVASFEAPYRPRIELAGGGFVEATAGFPMSLRLLESGSGARRVLQPPPAPEARKLLQALGLNGGAVSLSRRSAGQFEVLHVDGEGVLAWQRTMIAGPDAPGSSSSGDPFMAVDHGGVCIGQRRTLTGLWLRCLSADDGSTRLDALVPIDFVNTPEIRRLPDGRFALIGEQCVRDLPPAAPNCVERRLVKAQLSAEGALQSTEVLGGSNAQWLWSESGQISVASRASASARVTGVRSLTEDGAVVAEFEVPGQDVWLMARDPQGRLLLQERDASFNSVLRQRSVDGDIHWERQRPQTIGYRTAHALDDGSWLLKGIEVVSRTYRLGSIERIDAATGERIWRRHTRSVPEYVDSGLPVLDAASGRLWLSTRLQPEGRLSVLGLDGNFLDAVTLDGFSDATGSQPSAAQLVASRDGVIALWVRPSDQSLQLGSYAPADDQRVDARAAAGIWNALDTPGQGLLLESFSDGEVLAGAWFTFSGRGGSADTELRWFAVQGERDGQHGYTLQIFNVAGGRFAEPPAVEAQPVGMAQLAVLACDRLLITYRFTEGEMADMAGAIPLRRTAGRADACGGVEAGQAEVAALNGSFFDPDSAGQGLLLQTVASDGITLLTGAWFTFDPEGAADDPGAQHWFTALGPPLVDGRSELALFRTFGAAFDLGGTDNTVQVGSLQVDAQDCGLRIQWEFDDSLAGGSFATRIGEQSLQPVDGCP